MTNSVESTCRGHLRTLVLGICCLATSSGTLAEDGKNDEDWVAPPPAATQPAEDTSKLNPEDAQRQARLWDRYSKIFAKRFYKFENDFVAFNYDPKYDNSRAASAADAKRLLTRAIEIRTTTQVSVRRIQPMQGEVDAYSRALPDMRVGQYGYIHSWSVEEILGPDSMMVSQIWLIDREQLWREKEQAQRQLGWSDEARDEVTARYKERNELAQRQNNDNYWRRLKVIGFPTRSLVPGTRWQGTRAGTGIQVAVLGAVRMNRGEGGFWDNRQVAVLMPAERLRNGLSEDDFKALLTQRGFSQEQFINVVLTELRKGSKGMEDRVIDVLDALPATAPSDTAAPNP